jgi:hypothetical protein
MLTMKNWTKDPRKFKHDRKCGMVGWAAAHISLGKLAILTVNLARILQLDEVHG